MVVVQGEFEELNDGKRLLALLISLWLCDGLRSSRSTSRRDLDFDLYIGASVAEELDFVVLNCCAMIDQISRLFLIVHLQMMHSMEKH